MRNERDFYEYLIKNILIKYKIININLKKGEKPDFTGDNFGLEITRAEKSKNFQEFVSRYNKKEDVNTKIDKFNKNYKKVGGKIIKKTDPLANYLEKNNILDYSDDYIYVIPSYKDDFNFINERIIDKLNKLNTVYDKSIQHYYLGIFSTTYVLEDDIKNELSKIQNIQSKYIRKYEKIIIVFLDKICEFDLLNNKYKVISNTNENLNQTAIITKEELYKIKT